MLGAFRKNRGAAQASAETPSETVEKVEPVDAHIDDDDDDEIHDNDEVKETAPRESAKYKATSPLERPQQPTPHADYKFGIADRLLETVAAKSVNMPKRSPDLVPLSKQFDAMRKRLRQMIATTKRFHQSIMTLDKDRLQMAKEMSSFADASPIESEMCSLDESHSFLSVYQNASNQTVRSCQKYQLEVIDYCVEWEAVVTYRVDKEMAATKKLRETYNHYQGKVDGLRKKVNVQEAKGKGVPETIAEKLGRNDQKLDEASAEYEAAAGPLCVLFEEVVHQGWNDLHPMLQATMAWEMDRSHREAAVFQRFQLETTGNAIGLDETDNLVTPPPPVTNKPVTLVIPRTTTMMELKSEPVVFQLDTTGNAVGPDETDNLVTLPPATNKPVTSVILTTTSMVEPKSEPVVKPEAEQETSPKMTSPKKVSSKKESSKKESTEKESSKKEASKKEATKKEASKKEASKKEASKKEASKKEASKKEASKKEASKKEPSKKEASKKEASYKKETSKKEGSKKEASKKEVLKELAPTTCVIEQAPVPIEDKSMSVEEKVLIEEHPTPFDKEEFSEETPVTLSSMRVVDEEKAMIEEHPTPFKKEEFVKETPVALSPTHVVDEVDKYEYENQDDGDLSFGSAAPMNQPAMEEDDDDVSSSVMSSSVLSSSAGSVSSSDTELSERMDAV